MMLFYDDDDVRAERKINLIR